MTKGLLLLFFAVPCLAEGPLYRHQDKNVNLEVQNIYQDIRSIAVSASTSTYINNSSIPQTATFNVSSGTVTGEFNVGTGGSIIKARTTGEVTQPLQPSFLATAQTGTNVTGDGTIYTVNYDEIFDQGADFASNTFTAPVTGKYLFTLKLEEESASTAIHSDMEINLVTSNRTYRHRVGDIPGSIVTYSLLLSVIADMDAGDTALVRFQASGGTKIVDVTGGLDSAFSGSLIN